MTLATGQILQNRYRIVSLLEQGGMGAVYRAWDTRLSTPVALKEMTPQPGMDSYTLTQLRRQFQQEAVVLARLDHPHLVDVTDFFEEGSNVYLVMKLIEGENLAERIARQGALPEGDVLAIADQLLDALAYCHSQGIIHRDIKPKNVIIRPDGRAVIVDFGLVKLWDPDDPHTRTAMRGMGTPEYAPPEQYVVEIGSHTDPRTDIYGLGATLYHALTGQPPPMAMQRSANPGAFQPPRTLNKRISPATEAAVVRAMELPVENRFPTVQDMAAALRGEAPIITKSVVARSTATRMASRAQSVAMPRRRVPVWTWALGGFAVLTVVVGLVIGLLMGNRGNGPTPMPTHTYTYTPSPTSIITLFTPVATATARPTSTSARTPTPVATATRMPTPTSTRETTHTPTSRAILPALVAPAQGGEFMSPITFQWRGSLNTGQAYQVTAYHPASGHAIQSGLLMGQSWTADLPGDKYGEWRWKVSVVQGGRTTVTSSEWMFWFNPIPGGGDDSGGEQTQPTNSPPDPDR